MPRWGQRAGTGGPHARHVGSGASQRSGTVGTSRVRHAEPWGSAQRGRSVHATHVCEMRPRGSRRACPSWGHACHLEPRRSGRGVRVGTRGARVSRAFTRVTGVAHTCVTRTGLALPLGSRVSPPPPHASLAPLRDNAQRRRASPQVTRVTPKAAGRPRGAHRGAARHDTHRHACTGPTLGVGPEEVAHGTVVGHLLLAVDGADLVQRLDGRREAPVHAKDLWGHACA